MTFRMTRYLLTGLMSVLVCGCSQADQSGVMKTKEIEALVRKEVPAGSSSAQVITFLDANKIEHSGYQEKQRTIYGIVRNTSQGAMMKGSIQIEFHFDERAKLKDHTVKEVFTGP